MLTVTKSIKTKKIIFFFVIALIPARLLIAQDYRYGVYIAPVISWFKTDAKDVSNKGARAGFDFSISAERHLTDNWHFSTGLAFTAASARLVSTQPSFFRFPNHTSIVAAGDPVIYRLQYISIPVGIKIKTDETGYFTYFAEFGLSPEVVINGKADIPSIDIKGENAMTEIRRLNLGYHATAGAEYSIDGNTSLILGLGYESNVFDVTKDYESFEKDRTLHKLLKFIFGINF
jgi:Outer membrane protein beta-barrel domain